tara:strand:- start:43 stop:2310 length:2268 start_codon:yes stop_codon:yes gene_type:complete
MADRDLIDLLKDKYPDLKSSSDEQIAFEIAKRENRDIDDVMELLGITKSLPKAPEEEPLDTSWKAFADAWVANDKKKLRESAPNFYGLLRGIADPIVGGMQLVDAVIDSPESRERNQQRLRDEKEYQDIRRRAEGVPSMIPNQSGTGLVPGRAEGFDWLRTGGNIASLLPLARIPGGQTTVTRIASGSGAGGLGATLLPTYSEDGFFIDKSAQTGVGAIGGGLLSAVVPPAIGWLGQKGGELLDFGRGLLQMRPSVQTQVDDQITASIGRELSDLPKQIQDSLRKDALEQLRVSGSINADALARKANLERWGLDPTSAQVSRDPRAWQREAELSKIDAGQPIRERFIAQDQRLGQIASEIPENINPGGGGSLIDMGDSLRRIASDLAKTSQKTVSQAYDSAAEAGLKVPIMNPNKLKTALLEVDEDYGWTLPPPVRASLKSIVESDTAPTIQQINNFIKKANRQKGSLEVQNATQEFVSALRTSLDDMAAIPPGHPAFRMSGVGEAVTSLKKATALAAKRFGFVKGKDGQNLSLVDDLVNNRARIQNLVKTKIMGGNPDDLAHLKRLLVDFDQSAFPEIPKARALQLWDDLRGAVLREITENIRVDGSSGKVISGARWAKNWRNLDEARHRILFSREEREIIESVIKAAEDLTVTPPYSYLNRSNTASNTVNYMTVVAEKVKGTPLDGFVQMLRPLVETGRKGMSGVGEAREVGLRMQGRTSTPEEILRAREASRAGSARIVPLAAPIPASKAVE